MTLESWRYRDPALVAEWLEQSEIRRDERMGQKLASIPQRIQRDMFRWGEWADRRQFWANLGITPFCKLVGLSAGGEVPDVRLDPQSMAIHKAVMRLDDSHKVVLYAYFVAHINHEARPELFNGHGVSRSTFYRRLSAGAISAHSAAMRSLAWAEKKC
jgi:hypothetical protein